MRKRFQKHKCSRGQAAIEFMVVMLAVFFFLFFYLSLAVTFVVSNYVDYATFMAARSYKAGAKEITSQQRYARMVLDAYMSKIEGIVHSYQADFVAIDPDDPQTAGILTSYDVDLFYMPPVFMGDLFPNGRITLHSEARLGRDPAFSDCANFFKRFSNKFNLGLGDSPLLGQMTDNGC